MAEFMAKVVELMGGSQVRTFSSNTGIIKGPEPTPFPEKLPVAENLDSGVLGALVKKDPAQLKNYSANEKVLKAPVQIGEVGLPGGFEGTQGQQATPTELGKCLTTGKKRCQMGRLIVSCIT